MVVFERLRDGLGPDGLPARFGGDEFIVLLEGVAGTDGAVQAAEKLIQSLRNPFYF